MPGKVKVNGAWKDVPEIYAKVNGAWKDVKEAYSKVNGAWQQWFALAQAVAAYIGRGLGTYTTYKIDFANDSISTFNSNIASQSNSWGYANPGVAGYFGQAQGTDVVMKITFPTDAEQVTTSLPATSSGSCNMAQHDGVAGYVHGGSSKTSVYKQSFVNDAFSTAASTQDNLSVGMGGLQNGVSYAYLVSTETPSNGFNKLTFANDSISTSTKLGDDPGASQIAFNYSGVAGYFPYNRGSTVMYKMAYPGDSISTITNLPYQASGGTSRANPTVAGYTAPGDGRDYLIKTSFPTDTYSTGSFPLGMRRGAAFADASMA